MEFLWDALKDSLLLLPFLFIAYIAIEVIEYVSANHIEHSRLLNGKYSTLFGASFGLIPQCGFSVVATDLFSQNKLKIGTLLAVYIATSDEAIPLILMNPDKMLSLIPLLLIKFAIAVIIGYSVDLIFAKYNKARLAKAVEYKPKDEEKEHSHDHSDQALEESKHTEEIHKGCCGHDIELNSKGAIAKQFLLHPLIHTLKIFAFILVINIVFGTIIHFVTEEKLTAFLSSSKAFAPLIAVLIGLIPNCASSVVITKLYLIGGLSFGAVMAGLIVNAGIALVVLFKQNKNLKENFAIVGSLMGIAIAVGYVIQLIGF